MKVGFPSFWPPDICDIKGGLWGKNAVGHIDLDAASEAVVSFDLVTKRLFVSGQNCWNDSYGSKHNLPFHLCV